MKALKIALIINMVLSLMSWGCPVRAQEITQLSNPSAIIIPAVNPVSSWTTPAQMALTSASVINTAAQQIAQTGSTIKNLEVQKVVDELISLKYGETSDSAYTDLGGIQSRQSEIFGSASDCLDRAVYLFNLGNELGLNASIDVLYDEVSGKGHALVEMDDGAGGRALYDLTSDTGTVSLSDYTDHGYTVVAKADTLEGLTSIVSGIRGAYNIAWDDDGGYSAGSYSGDDAYGAMCSDDNSWGTSSYDGGGDAGSGPGRVQRQTMTDQ